MRSIPDCANKELLMVCSLLNKFTRRIGILRHHHLILSPKSHPREMGVAVEGGCVSSRELHSGSGMSGVSAGRRVVARSVIVVTVAAAVAALVITLAGAALVVAMSWSVAGAAVVVAMSWSVSGTVPTVAVPGSGPGVNIVIVGAGIPVWPMWMRLHWLPLEVEMEDGGMAQGIPLMPGVVGYEDLLPHGDVARFGDHEVEHPAGNAPIVGHVLVHGDGDGLAGGGSQILIGTIQCDRSAHRFGVDL